MFLAAIRTYWATILGGLTVVGIIVASIGFIGHTTVDDLVDTDLRERVRNFAAVLVAPDGHVNAFLTGISRDPDAEEKVRKLATMAGIESFAVYAADGQEAFRSRSDRYDWLMRDRPGGIRSGNRLSSQIASRTGEWQVVERNGGAPTAVAPLRRNGETIGFVSIEADMRANRAEFRSTVLTASGTLLGIILIATGIPVLIYIQRKRKIEQAGRRIDFLANHDALTKLFNRSKMQEETDRAIAMARVTRERMAYLYIDIDELSEINDGFGQAFGDEVLRTVAMRLAQLFDRADLVGRIAADDFAVLKRRVGSAADIEALADQIVTTLGEPIAGPNDHEIRPKISIGCAIVPDNGKSPSELLKHAELAHQHNKNEPNQRITFFEPAMDELMHRRRQIESLLRRAIEEDLFELHYQPLVSGDGAAVLGFEALLRMRDENGNHIPPSVFVPIAEARGYIKAMGTWVIQEAARQAASWPKELFVSVNLSAVQFNDSDLVQIVADALDAAGIPGSRLEIEVVESLVLERSEAILEQLRGLRALGISIDMDDFGTGYSSLGYLWRFPFDKVKIDQSFMVALARGEPNVPRLLETIIAMAHHMNMKVTTEGVETQAQAELLKDLGCDQLQGYLFGRPMPADRVAAEILTRFRTPSLDAAGLPKVSARQSLLS